MNGGHWRATSLLVLVAMVLVAMVLGGCSDEDGTDGAEGASTSTIRGTTTTGRADPEVVCEESAVDLAPVGPVEEQAQEVVDLDGDGAGDLVTIYGEAGSFRVRADMEGTSVDAPLPIEDRTAEPRVLGGHDVDGGGTGEMFFEAARGAAAVVVGLVTLTDACELRSVRAPDGSLARFPVGASAATQQGLACRNDRLVALTGETTDGRQYQWSEVVMELEGAGLSVVSTDEGTYRSPADGAEIRRLGTLTCGDVTT